jgi:hypothetical protein
MTTIHLTKKELHAVASMVNVTAPKDHVRAMAMVQVTVTTDSKLTAIATNRMVIGEQTFELHNPVSLVDPLTIMLSPNILKVMKTAKFDGALTIADNQITYTDYSGSSLSELLPKDKMPDLSGYLPSTIDFGMIKSATDFTRLNLDLLVQISKLRAPSDDVKDNPVFDLYTQDTSEYGKPNPIILTRAARSLMAVVQPMYVK